MRCLYREKIYICGDYAEIDIFPVWYEGRKSSRRRNYRPTSAVQAALNEKNAKRKLTRLINSNFTRKDIQFNLSYADEFNPTSDEEAIRNIRNYIRRIKRLFKKLGTELKYVAVTEKGESKGRYHHHMIMSGGVPIDILAEVWGMGYTSAKALQFTETGIEGLARYMTKKTIGSHRYIASRNLEKPVESERTGVISQRKVKELANEGYDAREVIKKIYKDYEIAEIYPFIQHEVADVSSFDNEVNKGIYLTVKLYKPKCSKPRRAAV